MVKLTRARLEGADLTAVHGLAYDQIELAEIDAYTKLPVSLY